MSERCQYVTCTKDVAGALSFFFGVRHLCAAHFKLLSASWRGDVDVAAPLDGRPPGEAEAIAGGTDGD